MTTAGLSRSSMARPVRYSAPATVCRTPWYTTSQPSGVSSGGGPTPIRAESHQPPGRAPNTGAVEHHELAVDSAGQQGGVLVLGCADHAEPLDGNEVLGGGQRDGRTARAEGGIGEDPGVELVDPGH